MISLCKCLHFGIIDVFFLSAVPYTAICLHKMNITPPAILFESEAAQILFSTFMGLLKASETMVELSWRVSGRT